MTQQRTLSAHVCSLCLLTVLLIFAPFSLVSQAQNLPPEVLRFADMVLYNGQVLTMDRDQPPINVTQAVAVRDGRILAVGETDRNESTKARKHEVRLAHFCGFPVDSAP